MPPPTQLYAVDRAGSILVFDPLTLGSPSGWSSNFLPPYPGGALGAIGYDTTFISVEFQAVPEAISTR